MPASADYDANMRSMPWYVTIALCNKGPPNLENTALKRSNHEFLLSKIKSNLLSKMYFLKPETLSLNPMTLTFGLLAEQALNTLGGFVNFVRAYVIITIFL